MRRGWALTCCCDTAVRGAARHVVVTTPISGWFGCGGERGPGVALLLGLARRVAAAQVHSCRLFPPAWPEWMARINFGRDVIIAPLSSQTWPESPRAAQAAAAKAEELEIQLTGSGSVGCYSFHFVGNSGHELSTPAGQSHCRSCHPPQHARPFTWAAY